MEASIIFTEPVLLLNVNFEPLNVCSTRRALAMVWTSKADVVLNGRGWIRSARDQFELPSIIRLRYLVRRPRPKIALTKREILRRDNYTCQYCGRRMRFLTIDHIIPRHAGGGHSWENLVAACQACNRRKGGKKLEQTGMTLNRRPAPPPSSAAYRFNHHLPEHAEWAPFIEGW